VKREALMLSAKRSVFSLLVPQTCLRYPKYKDKPKSFALEEISALEYKSWLDKFIVYFL